MGFYGPLSSGSVMLHTHEPGAAPAQAWAPQRSVMVFLPGSWSERLLAEELLLMQRLMVGQGTRSKHSVLNGTPIPLRLSFRILQKMARKDCESQTVRREAVNSVFKGMAWALFSWTPSSCSCLRGPPQDWAPKLPFPTRALCEVPVAETSTAVVLGCREMKAKLSWKLSPGWLALIVPEYAMKAPRGKSHQQAYEAPDPLTTCQAICPPLE